MKNKNNKKSEFLKETEIEEVATPEVNENEIVEPEVNENEIVEPEVNENEEDKVESVASAIVAKCKALNVRKEANKTSNVVCVIYAGTEVTVDLEKSTDEFYKVYTSSNTTLVEGYCVKEFIEIR